MKCESNAENHLWQSHRGGRRNKGSTQPSLSAKLCLCVRALNEAVFVHIEAGTSSSVANKRNVGVEKLLCLCFHLDNQVTNAIMYCRAKSRAAYRREIVVEVTPGNAACDRRHHSRNREYFGGIGSGE